MLEVSQQALDRADEYRLAFLAANPFKHVVIEDFLEPAFAESLLTQFPSFDKALAKSESGMTGGKAVQTNIRVIGPAYQRLYETIAGRPFLDFVSQLSGIPDLILDPKMFGGGTHDNLHGQELDPHVDFNYDEARQLHRRLNLIVYLNKEWRTEWGGALEIHSNPRTPAENRIQSYDPLFNRCVLFETNEYSWHGFPKIDLPEDKRYLSRKSISIYLYTKDRPAIEVAPLHGTFYVQRPLPQHLVAGHVLTAEDVVEIEKLLTRRDGWIEMYQKSELSKGQEIAETTAELERRNREIDELASQLGRVAVQTRAPLTGYLLQEGSTSGLYFDDWASSRVQLTIKPQLPVSELVLRGYRPEAMPPAQVEVNVNGQPAARGTAAGAFEIVIPLREQPSQIEIVSMFDNAWAIAQGEDRDLAFVMMELSARHPQPAPH